MIRHATLALALLICIPGAQADDWQTQQRLQRLEDYQRQQEYERANDWSSFRFNPPDYGAEQRAYERQRELDQLRELDRMTNEALDATVPRPRW